MTAQRMYCTGRSHHRLTEHQSNMRSRTRSKLISFISLLAFCTMILICKKLYDPDAPLFIGYSVDLSDNDDDEGTSVTTGEPIHLFTIIRGQRQLVQALTLIKSILYYQGRMTERNNGMCYGWHPEKPDGVHCQMIELFAFNPLYLHWVIESSIRMDAMEYIAKWSLEEVTLVTYDMDDLQDLTDKLGAWNAIDLTQYYKLIVHEIVPPDVQQVIVIDPSVLFTTNIAELWAEFRRFNINQTFGAVCSQKSKCLESCSAWYDTFQVPEIDLGVVLLNLVEMRQLDWSTLCELEMANQLNSISQRQMVNDQNIIKSVLAKNPGLYYALPCEWNVQLESSDINGCCPSYWIDRDPVDEQCSFDSTMLPRSATMARALQFDVESETAKPMPDNSANRELEPMFITTTGEQLRDKFYQTYYTFRRLPISCFA